MYPEIMPRVDRSAGDKLLSRDGRAWSFLAVASRSML